MSRAGYALRRGPTVLGVALQAVPNIQLGTHASLRLNGVAVWWLVCFDLAAVRATPAMAAQRPPRPAVTARCTPCLEKTCMQAFWWCLMPVSLAHMLFEIRGSCVWPGMLRTQRFGRRSCGQQPACEGLAATHQCCGWCGPMQGLLLGLRVSVLASLLVYGKQQAS